MSSYKFTITITSLRQQQYIKLKTPLLLLPLFLKVPLEIPLVVIEDFHLPPKIVIMTTTETIVPSFVKAHGGTAVAFLPT